MHDEDLLHKELEDVPPVPSIAFSQIERKIKSITFRNQIVKTLAAALILTIGVQTWFFIKQSPDTTASKQTNAAEWSTELERTTTRVVPTEVADELQIARDFMNGDDLYIDTAQYAFLNNDDF